jgi:hypothetical protein
MLVLYVGPERMLITSFSLPMAKFMWAFLSEALGWNGYPTSMTDLLSIWLPKRFGVSYHTSLCCFAGLHLTLCTTRKTIRI